MSAIVVKCCEPQHEEFIGFGRVWKIYLAHCKLKESRSTPTCSNPQGQQIQSARDSDRTNKAGQPSRAANMRVNKAPDGWQDAQIQ